MSLAATRFDKSRCTETGVKEFLENVKRSIGARGETQSTEQSKNRPGNQESAQQGTSELTRKLKSIKRELSQKKRERSQIAKELHAAKRKEDRSERIELIRRRKSNKQEIFRLEEKLRAAKAGTEDAPETGSLPDFVIIGAPKCGTTFLYHLLSKHPHVEPAAFKEPHYFDLLFDKGIEWYSSCFPAPRWRDGRRTVTGEATPSYLLHPRVPERMAKVIPRTRLIALLRNPVDRTYSGYQFFEVRHGREKGTFEETIATYLDLPYDKSPLRKSVYVDHLLRWSRFFDDEQMLVLKSEDFFESPLETLKGVLDFIELPDWRPETSAFRDKRNKGSYEQTMDPTTRRRVEEYFEPHNQRLYDYLGIDFEW